MKNWKSTISGACSALGVFLFGAPIVINATSPNFPSKFMVWMMGAGFILQGLGTFFGHLFSADAKALKDVSVQVQQNSQAIASGDSTAVKAKLASQTSPTPTPVPPATKP